MIRNPMNVFLRMTNSFDSFLSLFVVVFLFAFFASSQTMAAAVNMRNAIQRCGFNLATSDFIMQQGYDSPEELLNVSEDDLDLMIRSASRHPPPDVTFPSLPIRKLYVLRFWADERICMAFPTGRNLFTEQIIGEYSNLMRSDEVDEVAAHKGQDPTKPDIIKS
jgi:hypothetical protein